MSTDSFESLRGIAWELLHEFSAVDGSLQQVVRVNGMVIPKKNAKAYKTAVAHFIVAKLQDDIPISIGYASEVWDKVFAGAKVAA